MEKIELSANKPPFQLFTQLRFAALAMAKESTRYSLNLLFISKERVVGTDGRRLHIGHFPKGNPFEPGFYDIVKFTKTKITALKVPSAGLIFPKYESTIPKHKTNFRATSMETNTTSLIIACLGKHNILLNYKFIEHLESCSDVWKVFYCQFDQPVRFVSDDKKLEAVIMPVPCELLNPTEKAKGD